MRRLLAAVSLCAAAFLTAACTNDTVTGSSGTPAPSSSSPGGSGTADPMAESICNDVRQNILNTDAVAFGTELGKMITARQSGNKAEETRAQNAAAAKLKEISGKLRADAAKATAPKLKSALTTSADGVDALAADTSNFTSISSLDQVSALNQKYATALAGISDYCAT